MKTKKDLESVKQLTNEDLQNIAKILLDDKPKKIKRAYDYLNEKYNVKFTYTNFLNFINRNKMKILKDELFNKYSDETKEQVESIKKTIEKIIADIVTVKQNCDKCFKYNKKLVELIKKKIKEIEDTEQKEQLKELLKDIEINTKDYESNINKSLALLLGVEKEAEEIKNIYMRLKIAFNNF